MHLYRIFACDYTCPSHSPLPRSRFGQVTEVQGWVAAAEMKGETPTQQTVDDTCNKLKAYFAAKQKLVEAL